MNMEFWVIALSFIGAFLAGVINTLAGNGSVITLSLMTEVIGLPPNVANGTNRLGLISQSVTGAWAFHRGGKLDINAGMPYMVATVLGAIPGIWIATTVSNDQFKMVFTCLMVLMLIVILVKPDRWVREAVEHRKVNMWYVMPLFVGLGFYGGFIQMGMGIFYLAAMVLISGFDIIRANAIKVTAVAVLTLLAILAFHWRGMIDWKIGMVFAVGQAIGGYWTAKTASKYPGSRVWAYRILVVVVILSILSLMR